MDNNIQIKEMPAMNLVYKRHTGSIHLIGQTYEKLMNWAGSRELLDSPNVRAVTVYHDNPLVIDVKKVRKSACITIDKEVKTEGEFGKLTVPGGQYAVGRFDIFPNQFEEAWNAVYIWFSERRYQPEDGFSYELYHIIHMEHPENKFIIDICVPVKPLS